MGLDGAWSFHPYLAIRLKTDGSLDPGSPAWAPRLPSKPGRLRRKALGALRAVASLALFLAR
jgi:hypothetical protein